MNSDQLIKHIRSFCIKNAHAENVVKYSRYFKDGLYDGYGLSAPQIYAEAKNILQTFNPGLTVVLETAKYFIASGRSEEITLSVLLVNGFHKQFDIHTFRETEGWFNTGINNWAHADQIATGILPFFLIQGIIELNDYKGWLVSFNKFQRRSVPVSFIKYLKKQPDVNELFGFIECLMTDPDREVHQGTGWFLREAWKKKPTETEAFLMKWKDTAARLIFQYATEKMSVPARAGFKRTRK